MSEQEFDVFLAYNSKDKPMIREIYKALVNRGIKAWLDEEEIAPGSSFQDEIQQAISLVKTAAVCIGPDSLGRWQTLELKTFITQCVERGIKVIPVLLPGVEEVPNEFLFLREFHVVWLRDKAADEFGLFQLEWGITGQKPRSQEKQPPVKPSLPNEEDVPNKKSQVIGEGSENHLEMPSTSSGEQRIGKGNKNKIIQS